jgi:hypothetical protein
VTAISANFFGVFPLGAFDCDWEGAGAVNSRVDSREAAVFVLSLSLATGGGEGARSSFDQTVATNAPAPSITKLNQISLFDFTATLRAK